MPHLIIEVHLVGGRFHGLETDGRAEWPPSPARLFQALVAGAARGATLVEEDKKALAWLERLDPPLIAAPARHKGQSFSHFMPNNDMDTVGGDPARMSEIRSATKRFHPQIFDNEVPFLYVWPFEDGREHADRIREIASHLYQLGRGVDMAWATTEVLDEEKANLRLVAYLGTIHRPSRSRGGREIVCPIPGSLHSLVDRFEKSRARFKNMIEASPTKKDPSRAKVVGQTFAKPPKPEFRKLSYDSQPVRMLYELRDMTKNAGFLAWPLNETVRLIETMRNDAAQRLRDVMPGKINLIDRVFGLRREATEMDKASRILIIPLPSIGHEHADHGIRRLLVEIPPDCPLAAKDIEWAFSATGAIDRTTGEVQWMLVPADGQDMISHFGVRENDRNGARIWRTVTPMALPISRPRGRMKGSERAAIERDVATAVAQALRHAGITPKPTSIRVQREPFDAKGTRAENFAPGTRFAAARLWHVEITFAQSISGPLLAGDGRYLGLGLMKPVRRVKGTHAFVVVDGLTRHADSQLVARALRRAVMALVQNRLGPRTAALPTFFTGHEADGLAARRGGRSHLAFAFDEARQRLLVIAPHLLEGRQPDREEREHLALLDSALAELRELRAGSAGLLKLGTSTIVEDDDPLFAHATTWTTQTEYRPTRHSKKLAAEQAIMADVGLELHRRGLPLPRSVEAIGVTHGPRGALSAQLKLVFSTAVRGPLLLGKTCNFGGGLFVGSK